MTIPVDVAKLDLATDGASTVFNLTGGGGALYFMASTDLALWFVDATGAATLLVSGVDYTIAGDGRAGTGILTMLSVRPAGGTIAVRRNTPRLQQERWNPNDGFSDVTMQNAQDRGRLIDQDTARGLAQALRTPDYDTPPAPLPGWKARAGKDLTFDVATGAPIASTMTRAQVEQAVSVILAGTPIAGAPLILQMSKATAAGMTLQQAGAAAQVLGATLSIDSVYVQTETTQIPAPVRFDGGNITTGAHDLTFGAGFSAPVGMHCFDSAGTGKITIATCGELPVAWFGAKRDGATDDRAAGQRAIATAVASNGGTVVIDGPLLLRRVAGADALYNGLVIPFNPNVSSASQVEGRVHLRFIGNGALLAGDDNMVVLRQSDSYSNVYNPVISGNGHAGVWGRYFGPENNTQTTQLVNQNYNTSFVGQISGCAEGDVYEGGPSPGGADSGCWYNKSYGLELLGNTRNIWMRNATSGGRGGINRTRYIGGRMGQGSNCGVYIDTGSDSYFQMDFEGIYVAGGPCATPTGVYIAQTGAADNNSNRFAFGTMEVVTRPFDNHNALTEIVCMDYDAGTCNFAKFPVTMLGGSDASQTPTIIAGFIRQGNSQLPGVPENGIDILSGGALFMDAALTSAGARADESGLVNYSKSTGTGPGGGTLTFDFVRPYVAMAEYHYVGAVHDTGAVISVYARHLGRLCETTSGTFVLDETTITASVGAPTTFAVSIARLNAATIRLTVDVSKAGTTFVCKAALLQMS